MTQVLDPSLVYWVLKMDDIRTYTSTLSFVGLLGIIFSLVNAPDMIKTRMLISSIASVILWMGVYSFLPSTQQLASVIVLPAITNSKFASETVGLGTDIVSLARKEVQKLTNSEVLDEPVKGGEKK